jgi:hypothetical protein
MFYRLIDFNINTPIYSSGTAVMPAGIAGDDTQAFGTA